MKTTVQPSTLLAACLILLALSVNSPAQNTLPRGRPVKPTTTVIIDYVDAYQAGRKPAAEPANHEGNHFVLIGGQWADAIPDTAAVDPALVFVVDLRGFPAGAEAAILNAFSAWEAVTAGTLVDWENSSFDAVDVVLGDSVNTYSMRNLGGGGVLAATYITWDDQDGDNTIDVGEPFLEMDVIHNSTIPWGTDISIPPGKKWFDLQGVATHEIGHVFGLDHPAGHDEDRRQTMYASIAARDTSKRSLEGDGDILGIQSSFLGYGAP